MSEATTTALFKRYQGGDEQVASELVERITPRLLDLIRRYLSPQVRLRVDEEDVKQSVLICLVKNARRGRVPCGQSGDLWRYLAKIAIRKARGKAKHHTIPKRNVNKERAFGSGEDPAAPGRSPAQRAEDQDALDHFMSKLSPFQRDVVGLRLMGYSARKITAAFAEIDPSTPSYEYKVRRALELVWERLEGPCEHFEQGEGPEEE